MNGSVNQRLMAGLLDQAYLEVIPTRSILDRLVHIPRHSLKLLKKQKGLLKKFISAKPYQPDDLLAGLQAQLHDPEFVISALHLFSFNDVERTENWRATTCEKLKGEHHAG